LNCGMTIRCAAGVPDGVSGRPTLPFHCCGTIPRLAPWDTLVHSGEGYPGPVKTEVSLAAAGASDAGADTSPTSSAIVAAMDTPIGGVRRIQAGYVRDMAMQVCNTGHRQGSGVLPSAGWVR
jgi:hypothetical protein